MKLQLIRNATMRFTYAGSHLLLDPCLAPKHSLPAFAGISSNPTVDLPMPPEEVIAGTELVIVSYLHVDHFCSVAEDLLPQDTPVFCQPGDETALADKGFADVTAVHQSIHWRGMTLTRTPARPAGGEGAERLGRVSGFVFRAEGEPTVYWTGDTLWYEAVAQVIRDEAPDVIVTHSGGAHFGDGSIVIMDAEETLAVCEVAPAAAVVAVHLEALDHCPVTRAALRAAADRAGIGPERLLLPEDGETLEFGAG